MLKNEILDPILLRRTKETRYVAAAELFEATSADVAV